MSDGRFLFHPAVAVSTAYTPNALNQYSMVGSASLSYDGNGNLTGDGTASFGYDTENHLISATLPGTSIAYAYDPLGRRASKTVNGALTDYLSAGDQEIAEYAASGTLLERYIYGRAWTSRSPPSAPGAASPITTRTGSAPWWP